jgi:uridine kinase
VNSPVILGIVGCSGSGKTTLADELARELEGTHFHLDHYYRDLSHLTYEERCRKNFDHPNELESDLLIAHVGRLAEGHAIHHPQYDFVSHTRIHGQTKRLEVDHLLIVDGTFALYYEGLRALYDFSVYVDAPDPVCYQRRLARDVRQRGRTPESVASHYAESVRPMAEAYVRPTSQYADLIVDGTASLDWSVEQVMTSLCKRGLLELLNPRQRADI